LLELTPQHRSISFEDAIVAGIKLAKENGFKEGFDNGVPVGYALAMEHVKSALSDGLRHGSPECGKVMQKRK
jgi:hypothetical protein